jgi:hypothetical protein
MPPNIPSFDPAKQEPLHPMRRTTSTVTTPLAAAPISASEINSLTSMLLLRTVQDLNSHDHIPSTPLPLSRTVDSPAKLACSPLVPTPSKLSRFLQYAEDNLGVDYATSYESSLRSIGAGPDILSEINDQELSRIGLTPGDIIRLKKGSVIWWNGPLISKLLCSVQSWTALDSATVPQLSPHWTNKPHFCTALYRTSQSLQWHLQYTLIVFNSTRVPDI